MHPMTRFIVDAAAVIHLASERIDVADGHELLAPTLLRSQALSMLHEAVHRGEIPADVGRDRLARVGEIKIRYLGDAVLRRRAWDIAEKLDLDSTYNAEYIALTQLQGDALVAFDSELAEQAKALIRVASIDDLK